MLVIFIVIVLVWLTMTMTLQKTNKTPPQINFLNFWAPSKQRDIFEFFMLHFKIHTMWSIIDAAAGDILQNRPNQGYLQPYNDNCLGLKTCSGGSPAASLTNDTVHFLIIVNISKNLWFVKIRMEHQITFSPKRVFVLKQWFALFLFFSLCFI